MGKIKEKKSLKQKHDALLETTPTCHTESSSAKSKKKQKERDSPAESKLHAEDQQGNGMIKKKKKKKDKSEESFKDVSSTTPSNVMDPIKQENTASLDDSYLEAPPRKKKKRLKHTLLEFTSRNESQEADVVIESEIQSTEESEERVRKRKKKLKADVIESEIQNTEESEERIRKKKKKLNPDVVIESEMQNTEESEERVKKNKKKLDADDMIESEMQNTEESEERVRKKKKKLAADVVIESEMQNTEESEERVRKKKKKLNTDVVIESEMQNTEESEERVRKKKKKLNTDVVIESEMQNTEESEERVKKKKKKLKADVIESEMQNTEESEERVRKKKKKLKADVIESEMQNTEESEERVKKKKKKLKADDMIESEMQSTEESEERVRKKKKKLKADVVIESEMQNTEESEERVKKKKLKADVVIESEMQNTEESEERVKKKKKKLKADVVIESEMQNTEESEERVRKKKKKLKADVVIESEMQNTEESEERVRKNKKKLDAEVTVTCEASVNEESESSRRKDLMMETDVVVQNNSTQTGPNVNEISKEENEERLTGVVGVKGKKRRKEENVENGDCLLEELKEFVPNAESKDSLNVSKMIKYDLPRFKEFKKQGIPINHGKFTTEENERLKKNVEDFMVLIAINNPTKLFFTHRFKEEKESLNKLKKLHKFFERISEGIPRSCFCIYARGRRMFDGQNYKGKFSESELHSLRKLHTLYGNNWKVISELTGRSANSLEKRFAQLSVKKGPWRRKEVKRLLRAVKAHIISQLPHGPNSSTPMRVSKEILYRKLPWQEISAKVKTRSWTQCREKWMSFLVGKMSSGSVSTRKRSLEIKIKLIKAMYEMEIEEAALVNWDDLANLIGDVPPTFVQRKWNKIKICNVPSWQSKCFADIVDFLYEKVLPDLKQRFSRCKAVETPVKENQESFLLTDIFQDTTEYNMDDEDEMQKTCKKE